MSESTARKFQNEETFLHIKDKLDVAFVNPSTMMDVATKAAEYAARWNAKKNGSNTEQIELCEIEVRKAEALEQHMLTLTMDAYELDATAYVDANFKVLRTAEDVILGVASKGDKEIIGPQPAETEKEDASVVSIFDGEKEVSTPSLKDLTTAVKSLLKKGHFDSANLMAGKYLLVGNYIPKKEKQVAEKWSEAKIASWIKDINNSLMDEKVNTEKDIKNQEDKKVKESESNAAAMGLTTTEVENLRLLETIIPDAIAGHQDSESRREKLHEYLNIGKELEDEIRMLNAVAKRIADANVKNPKLPENDLAKLFVDIDAFCKIFFSHRLYTPESIKAWRTAVKSEVDIEHFKYLTTEKDVNPTVLKTSLTTYEQLVAVAEREVKNSSTADAVYTLVKPHILGKEVKSSDGKVYPIYTKLHADKLINEIWAKLTVPTSEKVDPDVKPTIDASKDKISISEIKLLLSSISENGGIYDDVKNHPEIKGLVGRKIQVGNNSPDLKFEKEGALFTYLESIFKEIDKKVKEIQGKKTEVKEYADLSNLLTLCKFGANNDVNQEDFIKEHKDLVIGKNGKFISMKSENTSGGSKTVVINSLKDFETWVADVYKTEEAEKEKPELVNSMKELIDKGKEKLEKGTTYELFIDWLKKNLLNRKMIEQKAEKVYKTIEAIIEFAKNTFGKKLPVPSETTNTEVKEETEVKETEVKDGESKAKVLLTKDEIIANIADIAKTGKVTVYSMTRMMQTDFKDNEIKFEDKVYSLPQIYAMTEDIIKDANPEMYKDHMIHKAEIKAATEANKTKKTETTETSPIVDNTIKVETPSVTEPAEKVEETVDAEHKVFEKVDVAVMDPELWKTIEKFTEMEEVYNMAVELDEAGKFNEALSMCLTIMPNLKDSKDWTSEQITDWFNKIVLKRALSVAEEASTEKETDEVTDPGEEYNEIKEASSPKGMKRAIQAILKARQDSKELRDSIIDAIKVGNGSHTRKVAKMPIPEIHSMLNNIKEKIGKFAEGSAQVATA